MSKAYQIKLVGCDDQTIFHVSLDDEEYVLVKGLCDKSMAASDYSCMPTMRITEATGEEE